MSSFTLFRSFLTFYHNKLCLEVIAQERENETIIRKEKSVFRKLLNGKMFSNSLTNKNTIVNFDSLENWRETKIDITKANSNIYTLMYFTNFNILTQITPSFQSALDTLRQERNVIDIETIFDFYSVWIYYPMALKILKTGFYQLSLDKRLYHLPREKLKEIQSAMITIKSYFVEKERKDAEKNSDDLSINETKDNTQIISMDSISLSDIFYYLNYRVDLKTFLEFLYIKKNSYSTRCQSETHKKYPREPEAKLTYRLYEYYLKSEIENTFSDFLTIYDNYIIYSKELNKNLKEEKFLFPNNFFRQYRKIYKEYFSLLKEGKIEKTYLNTLSAWYPKNNKFENIFLGISLDDTPIIVK